jgi:hypothetical protein
MSSRTTAILVAVAVVAGIVVAAVGLATRGSGKAAPVLQIDEVNGRVGSVVLGETRENVIGTLGKPRSNNALARQRPPVTLANTSGLLYEHLLIELQNGRVISIETDDPQAQTKKVVKIGDPLSAARASYRKAARCVPNSPDRSDPFPRCTIRVPAGRLFVRGDPIKAMTLSTG